MAAFIPVRHRLQTRMIASILALLALLMLATAIMVIIRPRGGVSPLSPLPAASRSEGLGQGAASVFFNSRFDLEVF